MRLKEYKSYGSKHMKISTRDPLSVFLTVLQDRKMEIYKHIVEIISEHFLNQFAYTVSKVSNY